MGSMMETHHQFLSHIGTWHDEFACDQDNLQLAASSSALFISFGADVVGGSGFVTV